MEFTLVVLLISAAAGLVGASLASMAYVRDGLSNVRIGMFLGLATTAGAICGAMLSSSVPMQLNGVFRTRDGEAVAFTAAHPAPGFSIMSLPGALSGLLCIGSGALKVVAMDRIMKIPVRCRRPPSSFIIALPVNARRAGEIDGGRGYCQGCRNCS